MKIDPQLTTDNIWNAVDSLIELRYRYNRCGEVYGADFTPFWEETVPLLFEEISYYAEPSPAKSRDLDDCWSEWANRIFRHLQNSGLDLDFSYERTQLREFLKLLAVNRKSV
jgi:hypothetical protein